ncbi:hypothetical protein DFJ73DRAFT_603539, partial [Zopfochytrium polystomum]
VQFEELMAKVGEALEAAGIRFLKMSGSTARKSGALQQFQKGGVGDDGAAGLTLPVLPLNVADESAACANLTVANDVVFMRPLLGATDEWTAACETQAIGRAKRYGQLRKVFVWRMIATDTIDRVLMEKRR